MVIAVVVAVSACGTAVPSEWNGLVRHRDLGNETMLATLDGVLAWHASCVVVAESGHYILPVWTHDAERRDGGIFVGGRRVAEIGGGIRLVGGFLARDQIERLLETPIPPDCVADDYFLVGGYASPARPT